MLESEHRVDLVALLGDFILAQPFVAEAHFAAIDAFLFLGQAGECLRRFREMRAVRVIVYEALQRAHDRIVLRGGQRIRAELDVLQRLPNPQVRLLLLDLLDLVLGDNLVWSVTPAEIFTSMVSSVAVSLRILPSIFSPDLRMIVSAKALTHKAWRRRRREREGSGWEAWEPAIKQRSADTERKSVRLQMSSCPPTPTARRLRAGNPRRLSVSGRARRGPCSCPRHPRWPRRACAARRSSR